MEYAKFQFLLSWASLFSEKSVKLFQNFFFFCLLLLLLLET